MTEISFEDLSRQSGSIYEAVVAMSRRARQITDIQKRQIEKDMDYIPQNDNRDLTDEFDEVEIDREALKRESPKYPKPTTLAMQEMANGQITFYFRDENEEAQEEEA